MKTKINLSGRMKFVLAMSLILLFLASCSSVKRNGYYQTKRYSFKDKKVRLAPKKRIEQPETLELSAISAELKDIKIELPSWKSTIDPMQALDLEYYRIPAFVFQTDFSVHSVIENIIYSDSLVLVHETNPMSQDYYSRIHPLFYAALALIVVGIFIASISDLIMAIAFILAFIFFWIAAIHSYITGDYDFNALYWVFAIAVTLVGVFAIIIGNALASAAGGWI